MSSVPDGLPQGRFYSLDVFRGITIAGMILVNNPGSWGHVYAPLLHAPWHGWTPTDFIFPFFLFIVGVAMAFSFSRMLSAEGGHAGLHRKVVRRALVLFALGLAINLIPIDFPEGYNWFRDTLGNVRIMGVLQRIGIVYLLASLIVIHTGRRGQIAWAGALLVAYWLVMKLVPFSVMQDGAAVSYAGLLDKELNLAAWLDDKLLHGHTWLKGTYFHHDPEGILSTIPAVATTLTGVFAGYWLRSGRDRFETVAGLFFAGVAGLVAGVVLDPFFPINKSLWSPSYVIFMSGMALLFLAMCFYAIDIHRVTWWTKPFIIFGVNALAFFMLAAVVGRVLLMIRVGPESVRLKTWIYANLFVPLFGQLNGSLAFALTYILIWLGVMTIFYRKRIFIKI